MAKKSVPASIKEVAFDCPHCGAYTTQTWFDLYATNRPSESRTPFIPTEEMLETVKKDQLLGEHMDGILHYYEQLLTGQVFLQTNEQTKYVSNVDNLNLSKCFSCGRIAVWVFDHLVHPKAMTGPEPNSDLPPDVLRDYEEASRVVSESPRGAAALLRLGIQKLCVVLGEKGERIDDDIASLVKKGTLSVGSKSA